MLFRSIKQPKNKHLIRATAKKFDNKNINFDAFKRIYQPNSSGWIFLRGGHGLPASEYNKAYFCGIPLENNYDRIKFLGTTIKTFCNVDLTCFGGAEHAQRMGQDLVMLSNDKTFTPYIYGIYALTAESVGISLPSLTTQKINDFFQQLRMFQQTKKIQTFKDGIENLFSFTPVLKNVQNPHIIPAPNILQNGISTHPLIFIPGMKSFTALPSSKFTVFNDPKAKPDAQNKKAVLLYTQEIEELNLQPTTITQIMGAAATNHLPHIISMCATQPSSLYPNELARFHEIKKLTTPTTVDQLVIESFNQSNDTYENYFFIKKLHALDEQNNPIILHDACIKKLEGGNSNCSITYKEFKLTTPFYRWQTATEEPVYKAIFYGGNRKAGEETISEDEYNSRIRLALAFKTKKNPHTYQKPLKALNRFVHQQPELETEN